MLIITNQQHNSANAQDTTTNQNGASQQVEELDLTQFLGKSVEEMELIVQMQENQNQNESSSPNNTNPESTQEAKDNSPVKVEEVKQEALVKEEKKVEPEEEDDEELSPTEQDLKNIEKWYNEIVHEWSNTHRVETAALLLEKFTKSCSQMKTQGDKEVIAHINQLFKVNKRLFQDIYFFSNYIQSFTTSLNNEKGWTVEKQKSGYSVKYKTGGSDIASLKIEGVMDVPLENLLSLIYELEFYNQWLPFMKYCRELKAVHKGCKISYMKLSIPPPLADRETLIMGCGCDRLDVNGTVVVVARSFDNDQDIVREHNLTLPKDKGNTFLAINTAGFEFKPLGANQVQIRIIVNVDPKIFLLPNAIMSFILRKAGAQLFDQMYATAKKFNGSVWEKKMHGEAGKEFYSWLKKRVDEEIALRFPTK